MIGPVAFGTFSVWLNNVNLFGLIGMYGHQNYVLKEFAIYNGKQSNASSKSASQVFMFVLLWSGFVGFVSAIFFYFLQEGSWIAGLLQIGAVVCIAILTALSSIHRSFDSYIIGISFDRLLYQILFLLIIITAGSYIYIAHFSEMAFFFALLIATVASTLFLHKKVGISSAVKHSRGTMVDRTKTVFPFFAISLGMIVNSRYQLALVGMFLSGEILGEIGVILTILGLISLPVATLQLVFGPPVARALASENESPDTNIVNIYLTINALGTFIAAIIVVLLYDVLLDFVGFDSSVKFSTLLILVAGLVVQGVLSSFIIIGQNAGHASNLSKIFGFFVVMKLVLGAFLTSQWGLAGLAIADIVVGIVLLCIIGIKIFRILGIQKRQRAVSNVD